MVYDFLLALETYRKPDTSGLAMTPRLFLLIKLLPAVQLHVSSFHESPNAALPCPYLAKTFIADQNEDLLLAWGFETESL